MYAGNILASLAICLALLQVGIGQQVGNSSSSGDSKNGTVLVISSTPVNLTVSQGTSSTAVPTTTTASGSTSQNQTGKNATGTTGKPEDDCSGEDGTPEPEGTSGDRTGKQLELNDKDKYKHDGATAEPEPEGEPTGNSTSAAGHLSGNATTPKPAHGTASSMVALGSANALAMIFASLYLKMTLNNL